MCSSSRPTSILTTTRSYVKSSLHPSGEPHWRGMEDPLPRSINSFNTLVSHFSSQYATSRSHRVTSSSLASLRQEDDEPLWKFMDKFGQLTIQITSLNPEVALHSMLLVQKASQQHGQVMRAGQGLHLDGRNVEILKWSSKGTKVWTLYILDGKSSHRPRVSFQCWGFHTITPRTSPQT